MKQEYELLNALPEILGSLRQILASSWDGHQKIPPSEESIFKAKQILKKYERVSFPISRFYGPISENLACDRIEILLDEPELKKSLVQFCTGEIDPRQLAYEIQVLLENIEEHIKSQGPSD